MQTEYTTSRVAALHTSNLSLFGVALHFARKFRVAKRGARRRTDAPRFLLSVLSLYPIFMKMAFNREPPMRMAKRIVRREPRASSAAGQQAPDNEVPLQVMVPASVR